MNNELMNIINAPVYTPAEVTEVKLTKSQDARLGMMTACLNATDYILSADIDPKKSRITFKYRVDEGQKRHKPVFEAWVKREGFQLCAREKFSDTAVYHPEWNFKWDEVVPDLETLADRVNNLMKVLFTDTEEAAPVEEAPEAEEATAQVEPSQPPHAKNVGAVFCPRVYATPSKT